MSKKAVVVQCSNGGMYFGYLVGAASDESVVLSDCRNCLRWDASVKGYVGLAVTGPSRACFVGPASPEMTLFGIESVMTCTSAAIAAWESAPWGEALAKARAAEEAASDTISSALN